jgi:hypothetical protein
MQESNTRPLGATNSASVAAPSAAEAANGGNARKTIDAVLPLAPRDLNRFRLLARSLERFMHDLGILWVVVPDADVQALAQLQSAIELPIRVIGESEWLPGMNQLPIRGWYKQQLVKLAAHPVINSEFYLTLDADVLCTRRCGYDELVPGGKALCHVMKQSDHQNWYDGAESVLGLSAKRRGVLHNVTPVVWSKFGVRDTVQHLSQRAEQRQFASGLRGLRQRVRALLGTDETAAPWVRYLSAATPWAEYATYFTFLEATEQFESYHTESAECIYDIQRSLWKSTRSLAGWDPAPLFEGAGPPYFAVVQSNAELPVAQLWQALEPWLGNIEG